MTTSPMPVGSPQGEPGPLFWLGARALTHVGEFRRYYALFAVWVLMMVAVPRTGLAPGGFDTAADGSAARGAVPGATRSAPRAVESAAAAGAVRPVSGAAATFFSDPVFDVLTSDVELAGGDALVPSTPAVTSAPIAFTPPPPAADEDPAPAADDSGAPAVDLPPPPPIPFPAPPAELVPLLSVVTPLGNTACSPIGLAGVVFALVAPSVQQVPAGEIVPYLTPLYVACGTFPQIGPRTVCELDDLYVSQDPTGGLLPPPAVIGIGIDTIAQLELAAGAGTSQAQALREQLNCHRG